MNVTTSLESETLADSLSEVVVTLMELTYIESNEEA